MVLSEQIGGKMRKKFESNVAQEIPKTKLNEPELPWKITDEDLEQIVSKDEGYEALTKDTSPLKARAIFLIALVSAVFLFIVNLAADFMTANENMRTEMIKRSLDTNTLQYNLQKAVAEKAQAGERATQLEKKVEDLNAQKALFTDVIESLTKKGEDVPSED
ncbi:MAG: hypothetical protein A2987_02660 [Omnitrophica bacterium RIFCSPLOWO2_01_FULL_45_10]|nr:MAG: hypothetical protein A2987_02660 [Omnitrophica bacterium RIFCSPLOWO2_01_FULL_45_10]